MTNCTMSERSYHGATSRSLIKYVTDLLEYSGPMSMVSVILDLQNDSVFYRMASEFSNLLPYDNKMLEKF